MVSGGRSGSVEEGFSSFLNLPFPVGEGEVGEGEGEDPERRGCRVGSSGERKRCACSCRVRRSARIWVGCQREERALRTGTGECAASSC